MPGVFVVRADGSAAARQGHGRARARPGSSRVELAAHDGPGGRRSAAGPPAPFARPDPRGAALRRPGRRGRVAGVDGPPAGDRRGLPRPARPGGPRPRLRGRAGDRPRTPLLRAPRRPRRAARAVELAPPRGRRGNRAAPGGEVRGADSRDRAGRTRGGGRGGAPRGARAQRTPDAGRGAALRALEPCGEGDAGDGGRPGPGVVGDGSRARLRRADGRGAAHPRPRDPTHPTRRRARRTRTADGVRRDVRAARGAGDGARGRPPTLAPRWASPRLGRSTTGASCSTWPTGARRRAPTGRSSGRRSPAPGTSRGPGWRRSRSISSPASCTPCGRSRSARSGARAGAGARGRAGLRRSPARRARGPGGDGEEHGAAGRGAGARAGGAADRRREHGRAGRRAPRGRAARRGRRGPRVLDDGAARQRRAGPPRPRR